MQKTTSVLLGALVVAVAALIIWRAGPRRDAIVVPPMASASDVAAPRSVEDAGADAADILDDPSFGMKGARPGYTFLDGGKPPELGEAAPSALLFGVVLVKYRGAQRAEGISRSKADALTLAKSLADVAKVSFDEAVGKGDPGSSSNAGWMPRGVLEPAPEYLLFTAAKGDVVGPVDTPTGYWVIKNLGK